MKVKKIFASIILSTAIIGNALTVSAATTHEHNYERHFSYEEAYAYDEICSEHPACKIHHQFMNVFDSCTVCGFRTFVKTEERIQHQVRLIDDLF